MKKNILLIGAAAVLLIGVFLFIPQDNDTARAEAEKQAEALRSSTEFPALLEQAEEDLIASSPDLSSWTLDIQAVEGNYFDFAATSPEGPGMQILAYRNQNGTFEKITEGQDHPDCFFVENRRVYFYEPEQRVYNVPTALAPICIERKAKDRTTPFSQLGLWLKTQ